MSHLTYWFLMLVFASSVFGSVARAEDENFSTSDYLYRGALCGPVRVRNLQPAALLELSNVCTNEARDRYVKLLQDKAEWIAAHCVSVSAHIEYIVPTLDFQHLVLGAQKKDKHPSEVTPVLTIECEPRPLRDLQIVSVAAECRELAKLARLEAKQHGPMEENERRGRPRSAGLSYFNLACESLLDPELFPPIETTQKMKRLAIQCKLEPPPLRN